MLQFIAYMKSGISQIIRKGLEERILPLREARAAAQRPARGWLRAVREAIGFSQGQVAKKLGVKQQSYAQFETAEERGSISLTSLRRAAEAMDCELVIPVGSLSRKHAEVKREGDTYLISDLGSGSGTWLGGQKRKIGHPHRIVDGDRYVVGTEPVTATRERSFRNNQQSFAGAKT